MGDKKFPPAVSKLIRTLVERSSDTFFAGVAAAFPECKILGHGHGGDIAPTDVDQLNLAMERAVEAWYAANRPQDASQVASCELRVIMRHPREGERMWWVSPEAAAGGAETALAEVLKESEELGFRAARDLTDDDSPDEDGMVAVVVEIRRVIAKPCDACGLPPLSGGNEQHDPECPMLDAPRVESDVEAVREGWDRLKDLP